MLDLDNRPCGADGCSKILESRKGECQTCRRYLCKEHYDDPQHDCPSFSMTQARERRKQLRLQEKQALVEAVSLIDLSALAQTIRPSHTAIVTRPESLDNDALLAGSFHIHLPVEFDDGVRWLSRVRQTAFDKPRYEMARIMMESEVTTHRVLAKAGLSVPNAWPITEPTQDLNICFVERISGVNSSISRDPITPTTLVTVTDYASFASQLSNVVFPRIGSLMGYDEPSVGPFISVHHWQSRPPHFLGPFSTMAERYTTYIDITLREIRDRIHTKDDPVRFYLGQLELREMIQSDEEMQTTVSETYIKHGDDWGSHLMVDEEGHITSIIDWDWAHVTSKAEAFAAPKAFTKPASPSRPMMELCPLETALAKAYDDMGRSDLGDCVRNGKKYQLLDRCVGYYIRWMSLKVLYKIFGRRPPGNGTEESWFEAVKQKYAENPGHHGVMLWNSARESEL